MVAEFLLLGEVQVRVDKRTIDVGHARQRCVLAALLVDANRAVSTDELIERVWADRPPQRARGGMHNYLSRLRRALAIADDVQITRKAGGYTAVVDPMSIDLYRFRHLVTTAYAATDDRDAAVSLNQALDLWRGDAFANLDTPWLSTMRATLDRERLAAELDHNDLRLRLGEHGRLITALSDAVAKHPLDERLAGQFMLALYRSGRQADALDHYHVVRMRLADDLGTDPAQPLRQLYQQMLTADRAVALPPAAVGGDRLVPAQLPPDVHGFTGRTEELDELDSLLATAGESQALVISAVSGTAGVGKTALAVHWAHRVIDRFPDGQLYLDLRGYDAEQPMPADEAAAALLRSLGVVGTDIPYDIVERAARYRSLVANRCMLILLDNAHTVEQIRPLLPGTPSSLVLVTSRDRLAGLVARHGARRVDLDLLPADEAVALLATLIGARVDADRTAALALAQRCARLPLALRVAAERAVARPAASLADLVVELDESSRLEVLDAGADERTAVRVVFSWSYRDLPAETGRIFRLVGLHPGADLDAYAAAALADLPVEQARHHLDLLARAHLADEGPPGRFGVHDLLRAYATELGHQHDSDEQRRTALTRLFDFYRATAAAAVAVLPLTDDRPIPAVAAATTPTPPLRQRQQAETWLEREHANLLAASSYTARHGWPAHTCHLAGTLCPYLTTHGQLVDAFSIAQDALTAAEQCHDRASEAGALRTIAELMTQWGHVQKGIENHQRALDIYRELGKRTAENWAMIGIASLQFFSGSTHQAVDSMRDAVETNRKRHDRAGEAATATALGRLIMELGQFDEAEERIRHGLSIFRRLGDPISQADTLEFLGQLHSRRGRHAEAIDLLQQALEIYARTGNRVNEAGTRNDLGLAYLGCGQYSRAYEQIHRAYTAYVEIGYRRGEASSLGNLGLVHHAQGRHNEALDSIRTAIITAQAVNDHFVEIRMLNRLGHVLRDINRPEEALTAHQSALAASEKLGNRIEQAHALNGIAHILHARGDQDASQRRWRNAITIYIELGMLDADPGQNPPPTAAN